MKERPIPFSAPMVRAILDGSKTQTRRLVKGEALKWLAPGMFEPAYVSDPANALCPYGTTGDRLWVREAWRVGKGYDDAPGSAFTSPTVWHDASDGTGPHETRAGRYRHARFMPRWASRITLEVTGVRVERLQDISEADAAAEGIERSGVYWRCYADANAGISYSKAANSFASLWESINGPASWDANPWVWCVTFRRL